MLKYKNEFSIAAMCRVLVVSRSGFYDWLVKQDKPRLLKHRQQQIDAHIAHAFNADKGRSGAIRVMLALDKKGIHYNFRRRVVKKNGMEFNATPMGATQTVL